MKRKCTSCFVSLVSLWLAPTVYILEEIIWRKRNEKPPSSRYLRKRIRHTLFCVFTMSGYTRSSSIHTFACWQTTCIWKTCRGLGYSDLAWILPCTRARPNAKNIRLILVILLDNSLSWENTRRFLCQRKSSIHLKSIDKQLYRWTCEHSTKERGQSGSLCEKWRKER